MARKSKAERKAALKKRTQGAVKNRDVSKYGGNDCLDMSRSGKKGKVNMFKVESGKKRNLIDILPFIISEEWYEKLKTFNGRPVGLEPGDEDYKVEYAMHRNIGPENKSMICLKEMFGMPCEACAQRDEEFQKDDPDEKILAALKPTWRCLYNVYDYNAPEKDIQIWDYSRFLFEAALLEEAENDDDGIVLFADIEEGKTLKFKGREKSIGKDTNSFVEISSVDFEDREPYTDEILDDTFPLDKMLVIPTVEEFTATFLGLDTDLGKTDPEPATQPARRAKPKPEEDENECPNGFEFGADCDKKPDCEDCEDDLFQRCADLQDELLKEPEPEPEPEKAKPRRRGEATKTDGKPISRRRRR